MRPGLIEERIEKLRRDTEEYYNSFGTLPAIDKELARLDIKDA